MINEDELWLELYKFISNKKDHPRVEVNNTFWESPSIKLTKTYLVSNWSTLDDEGETSYIESDSNTCYTLVDCLVDVVNKLKEGDWTY